MQFPHGHPCAICGSQDAPWGYRLPGPQSDLPEKRRGYLWACAAHRDEAARRQAAATGVTAPAPPERQGKLF